jgi:L-fucose isomerase-like protein
MSAMQMGKAILLGVARPGFDTDLALRLYRESAALLEKLGWSVLRPDALLTDPDEAGRAAAGYRDRGADALIVQWSTFTDGRFLTSILGELDLPILVWSVPEPEIGGRLRLNSLTGGNLAASILVRLGRRFKVVYRLPSDGHAQAEIGAWLAATRAAARLKQAVVVEVGNPPPGFYTSTADALALLRATGIRLTRIDLQTVLRQAAQIPPARYQPLIEADQKIVAGLPQLANDQVVRSTQFTLALRDALGTPPPDAVAVRCWPEFFNEYKAAACSTLSHLIEDGIPAACEADTLGAVTMLMQQLLTGQHTYLGDLVHVDDQRNTCTFWHCGVGAFSLASPKTGPVAGVQPNRNLGFALNHSLKAGPVTIARLGQGPAGLRLGLLCGEAVDGPNTFTGTSVEVRMQRPVREILEAMLYEGFEHHYAVVWQDVRQELVELSRLLSIPCVTF